MRPDLRERRASMYRGWRERIVVVLASRFGRTLDGGRRSDRRRLVVTDALITGELARTIILRQGVPSAHSESVSSRLNIIACR